ncbi:MAG: CopG family ribbon-helix-helix protein [Paracoccus sp. (in: a-proteobacteria)]|nr:CopG family ribbon-helix-helix protein [Paracoccus sp. (in: a-proteobacteria)]
MSANPTMTIRVRPEVKEKLELIAATTQRSKSFVAAEALSAYADRELEIINGIKRGLSDADAGRLVPHEQVIAEMREIVEDAKRRRAAEG